MAPALFGMKENLRFTLSLKNVDQVAEVDNSYYVLI
jgi:hypothetical protein